MSAKKTFLGTWVLSKIKPDKGEKGLTPNIKIRFDPDGTYEIRLQTLDLECTFHGTYQVSGNQIKRFAQGRFEVGFFTYDERRDMLTELPGAMFTHVA